MPNIGDTKTMVYRRHDCDSCDKPATQKLTWLLENARNNPGSSAYGRSDDISYCSDREASYACEDHHKEMRWEPPTGYQWASSFGVGDNEQWLNRVCYWAEE